MIAARRRPILIALMALMIASSARADDQAPGGKPHLILWHAYRGSEKDALETVVQAHNADARTPYQLDLLSIPYDALVDKITAAVPRGRGPDLFIFAHDTIGDWAEAGILQPMEGAVEPTVLKGFLDETLPPLIYRGKLYGLPLAFKSTALIYRTDIIRTPPATTDEMIALAKPLTNVEQQKYGLVYENGLLYFHAAWMFGFGGSLFGADGRPHLDSPQNAASLAFAARLLKTEHILPQEANGALVAALIGEGKAAMAISGPWLFGDLPPDAPVAVAPLPIISGTNQRARPFMTTEAVFVSAKGTQRDLASAAAAWLSGEQSAQARLVKGRQPVAFRTAWDTLPKTETNLWAFRAQLKDTVPTPNTPAMKSLWAPMDNAINLVLHGTVTPEEALKDAQAKVEGVIAKVDSPVEEGPFYGFFALLGLLALGVLAWAIGQIRTARAQAHLYDAKVTRLAYTYAAPALLAMAVLTFVPFLVGIGMGFFRHTYGRWDFVGLSNYRDLLTGTDGRFLYTLTLTFGWTLLNVALHVGIGLFLALMLNRPQLKGRAVYRVLLIVPWAVPSYITALIWKGMFHPDYGVVNEVLALIGFNTRGMSWMAEAPTAFSANLITNTWLGFPFMMVVCLGALQSIPPDLYEAARLDGASSWQQFTRITLPLLRPALVPAVLLGSVWTFNQFNVVYLVSGGGPDGKTDLLVTEAFRWAFERGPGGAFGLSAAYSTLIFLILLVYSLLVNRVTGSLDKALE
jgi:arabinogalactan oligomer/maltooligosaccharide transport system permease protein